MALAPIVSPNYIPESNTTDNTMGSELSDAFARAATQLGKKKDAPDNPTIVTPGETLVPQIVPVQDRRDIQPGSRSWRAEQAQSVSAADSVKVQQKLSLNSITKALQSVVARPASGIPHSPVRVQTSLVQGTARSAFEAGAGRANASPAQPFTAARQGNQGGVTHLPPVQLDPMNRNGLSPSPVPRERTGERVAVDVGWANASPAQHSAATKKGNPDNVTTQLNSTVDRTNKQRWAGESLAQPTAEFAQLAQAAHPTRVLHASTQRTEVPVTSITQMLSAVMPQTIAPVYLDQRATPQAQVAPMPQTTVQREHGTTPAVDAGWANASPAQHSAPTKQENPDNVTTQLNSTVDRANKQRWAGESLAQPTSTDVIPQTAAPVHPVQGAKLPEATIPTELTQLAQAMQPTRVPHAPIQSTSASVKATPQTQVAAMPQTTVQREHGTTPAVDAGWANASPAQHSTATKQGNSDNVTTQLNSTVDHANKQRWADEALAQPTATTDVIPQTAAPVHSVQGAKLPEATIPTEFTQLAQEPTRVSPASMQSTNGFVKATPQTPVAAMPQTTVQREHGTTPTVDVGWANASPAQHSTATKQGNSDNVTTQLNSTVDHANKQRWADEALAQPVATDIIPQTAAPVHPVQGATLPAATIPAEFTQSVQAAQPVRVAHASMQGMEVPSSLTPQMLSDVMSQTAVLIHPEQGITPQTIAVPVEFAHLALEAKPERVSPAPMQSTVAAATVAPQVLSAAIPETTAPAQRTTQPAAVVASAAFTQFAQAAQPAQPARTSNVSTQSTVAPATLPSQSAQFVTAPQIAPVQVTALTQPTQTTGHISNVSGQNTGTRAASAPHAAPQIVSKQETTPPSSAQLVNNAIGVVKTNVPLSEVKNVKTEKQELSEIISALSTITPPANMATTQQTPSAIHQEQWTTSQDATRKQVEVLAIRDKNSSVPTETKVSLAWGGDQAVYISKTPDGYKLRASDNQVKEVLERNLANYDGALSLGVTSVETATDKQPKQRQSTNQYNTDNAEE